MNISTFQSDLIRELHGTSLNKVQDVLGLINAGARDLLIDVDPQETIRILPITNSVFNSVFDYPLPPDLKGNRIIDIRPQANRTGKNAGIWLQEYSQFFDTTKGNRWRDSLSVQFNTASKYLRLNSPTLQPPDVFNTCASITGQGTWSATGNASNLQVDNVNYVVNNASLSFNLSGGSSGSLVNSTQPTQNLSAMLNQGTAFLYTFLPTASAFTSVQLQWGSSASNYYQVSQTLTQQGTAFQNGWNLLAFNWLGATVVGTPDDTNLTYVNVTWNYNGTAQTAVRLSQITFNLGTILNLVYYSKYLFRDASTGAFQETVTDVSNLINLDTESYNLLLYKTSELMAQQTQGLNAEFFDDNFFTTRYQNALQNYQRLYPSQVQLPQSVYYQLPKPQQQVTQPTLRGY